MKSKIRDFIGLIIASVFLCSLTKLSLAQEWKEKGSDHFIIYFMVSNSKSVTTAPQGAPAGAENRSRVIAEGDFLATDDEFAEKVLEKAEIYYKDIASELGYPRYSEFWVWDKRTKIYIYPDHASYLNATGEAGWTHGIADYKKKSIISYAWGKDFVESLLPHEMGHLIFRDFVGFKGEIPLWLDEGVAQWSEESKREEMKGMALEYYYDSRFLLLEDMMKLDIRALSKNELLGLIMRPTITPEGGKAVLIITSDELITTYYLQGVSLIGFLIEAYGSTRLAEFCRQLRDGKDLEEALIFAYPTKIRSLKDLEENWRKYLAEG